MARQTALFHIEKKPKEKECFQTFQGGLGGESEVGLIVSFAFVSEPDFIKERIIQASKLELDLNNSRKWIETLVNLFLTLNQALIWQLFICQGLYCKDSNGIHLEFNSLFLFQSLFLNLGSDLWVRMSVRHSDTLLKLNWCDSGSILTDNANRAIQGNVTMQWSNLVADFANNANGATWWSNFEPMQVVPSVGKIFN